MDAKKLNSLASEDTTVPTAPLTSSKGIFGMRTLIRITVQGQDVSVPVHPQMPCGHAEAKIILDIIEQSIQFTDVYRMMIRPLSGGLESIAKLFN